MKNIWIINHYAGSPYHGMEFRHYNIARKLIEKGYNVTIIASAFTHLLKDPPIFKVSHSIQIIDNISYCWIKTPRYQGNGLGRVINMLAFSGTLLGIQNSLNLSKPDYVIASSPHIFVSWNGRRVAQHFRAKFIFEVRDIWPLTITELQKTSKHHPFVMLMQSAENYAYKHADLIISPLPNLKKHLSNIGFPNITPETIPNGLLTEDFENWNDSSDSIRNEVKQLMIDNKFIVCFAGTLSKSNSVDILIDAARIIHSNQRIHFIVIGDGEEKRNLIATLKEYKLTNVTFMDRMNRVDLLKHLIKCHVFYNGAPRSNLYSYGVSPIKVAEYMFMGKPIVDATEAYNNPIQEANCGIVTQAENSEALAAAIIKLYSMSERERQVLGENGKNYVIKNLTYECIVDKLITSIERL